jgi:general secretion pathway protein K
VTRPADAGVVLINVLVLLGLAATVVYMMLSLGDLSIARSQRFGEAGQALALIRAGEQSAIVALRRDMIEAPGIDHAGEAWGSIAQDRVAIEGGSFELRIADAQGRFNLNVLTGEDLQASQTLEAIVADLELPRGIAARIAASIARDGPLRELGDLTTRAGIAPADVELLATLVTALPGRTDVNVNAAPPELLAILLQNSVQARVLAATRARVGFLTPENVEAAGAILPPGVGFVSSFFEVSTAVQIGGTRQAIHSLVQRRRGEEGVEEVAVVRRRNATAAVPSPPPPSS